LGTLRLVERLAAIGGLLACALIVDDIGYDGAVASLGWLMLGGLCVLALGRFVPRTVSAAAQTGSTPEL
jgi:hypothetical protein